VQPREDSEQIDPQDLQGTQSLRTFTPRTNPGRRDLMEND